MFSITISNQGGQDQHHFCLGKSRATDNVCETRKVPSMVECSLFILHAASSHSASTEEPVDQPAGMMLLNGALGQLTLSYQWWTLVPKATIPWSNNGKHTLTWTNL